VEFAMNEGEIQEVKCTNCSTTNHFHVDELEAKQSKLAHGIAAVILFVGTPLLCYFMWEHLFGVGWVYAILALLSLLGLPLAIYIAIHRSEQRRVNSFNRLKLKARP